MKFITEVIKKHFTIKDSRLLISLQLAEYLVNEKLDDMDLELINSRRYIDLGDDVVSQAMGLNTLHQINIKRYLFSRGYFDSDYESYLIDEVYCELTNTKKDYKKYFHDYRSYGLSIRESIAKAKTFSSFKILLHFYKSYSNERLLYKALIQSKAIDISPKKFCSHLRWLKRIGLFKGTLLGKKKINMWTINQMRYGIFGIRK